MSPRSILMAKENRGERSRSVVSVVSSTNRHARRAIQRASGEWTGHSEGQSMATKLTRRALLQTAGGMMAATAMPGRPSAPAAAATAGVIDQLASYMAAAAGRDLPAEAVEHTKHHILDTFAAMISGAALPPGRVALAFARARAGEKVATVAASDVL